MELLNSLLYMLNEMSPYILLGFFIAGLMHAFIPRNTFARHLAGNGWRPVVKAALIGIPLPLCSCGVLPTAIAMRRNGASRAASTSFLVSTPQTGVDSIAATWSLLGPAFAVVRPVAALVTSFFGGVAVGKSENSPSLPTPSEHLNVAKDLKASKNYREHNQSTHHRHVNKACCDDSHSDHSKECHPATGTEQKSFARKLVDSLQYGFVDLVSSIGGWLVVGLIIAAIITVYVPSDFFVILGKTPFLSMIAVLIVAIPMYVCATGSIPIALSLMLKGLSPGTALVLLMAGPAANFASFTLISREMGKKAASIYLASIIIGAMAFGLAIDYLLPASWFEVGTAHDVMGHHHHFSVFSLICSAVLVILLLYSFVRRYSHKSKIETDMTTTYLVEGMNCPHCQATVTRFIAAVEGVKNVDVNLSSGLAVVEGEHDKEAVILAVRNAGFDASLKS